MSNLKDKLSETKSVKVRTFAVIGILFIFLGGIGAIGVNEAYKYGYEQGTLATDEVQVLENRMWDDTVNQVENRSQSNVTVACSENTDYSDKYSCVGMVERGGPNNFNIVFRGQCPSADNTKCNFDYWDRGTFLFSRSP